MWLSTCQSEATAEILRKISTEHTKDNRKTTKGISNYIQ